MRFILPLAMLGLLLAVWTLVAGRYPEYILPNPAQVWSAFIASWRDGTFQPAFLRTLNEALLGWGIGALLALPIGYLCGRWRWLEYTLAPFIAGSQAVPVIAIAPLLLLWIGFGMELKVVLAAVIAFFPVMATTLSGIRAVDADLRGAARVFGAGPWQTLTRVEAPLAARSILAGARIAILLAVVGAYVGELVNPDLGLGQMVVNNTQNVGGTPTAYVGVVALILMGALLYSLLTLIERQILLWLE